jgi:RNA polymerase sigma factor (sigma-70 family)
MLHDSQVEPSPLTLLLSATAARDQRAFADLYGASSAKLYGVIVRILRDREQANEVLQEVYLRIWQHAADYRPDKGSPMTWMIAVARNRALDRRRAWHPELPLDEIDELEDLSGDRLNPLDGVVGGRHARSAAVSASSRADSANVFCWLTPRAIPMPSWRNVSTARSTPSRA